MNFVTYFTHKMRDPRYLTTVSAVALLAISLPAVVFFARQETQIKQYATACTAGSSGQYSECTNAASICAKPCGTSHTAVVKWTCGADLTRQYTTAGCTCSGACNVGGAKAAPPAPAAKKPATPAPKGTACTAGSSGQYSECTNAASLCAKPCGTLHTAVVKWTCGTDLTRQYTTGGCKCGGACKVSGKVSVAAVSAHAEGVGTGLGENSNPVNKVMSATLTGYKSVAGAYLTSSKVLAAAAFTATDTLNYDASTGNFTNTIFNLGNPADGNYQIVFHTDGYLDAQMKNGKNVVLPMAAEQELITDVVDLIPGDIGPGTKGDNAVDIIDYNKLVGCFGKPVAGTCALGDLNNDGIIDIKDFSLLLTHFYTLGFSFESNGFTCTLDPACMSGQNTLQMCTLICTKQGDQ